MPYKDPTTRKLMQRIANQKQYAKRKAAKEAEKQKELIITASKLTSEEKIEIIKDWSIQNLVIPPGHPNSGKPMELPKFAEDFILESFEYHESALSVARKNGKSAICAILVLAHLCCPDLAAAGWRGAVASLSKEKAAELRNQVQSIAEASNLNVTIKRTPYPGAIVGPHGKFETLSADRGSGHASGFDLVIVDETGLMPERCRELLAGLRSSISAKGGRIIHISVRGDSPLFEEILNNPAVLRHVYCADEVCEFDDEEQWFKANPTLGQIKQLDYMRKEYERVKYVPADIPSFQAFDLNQKVDPDRSVIVSLEDWLQCIQAGEEKGDVVLGIDLGGSTSMSACVAIFKDTGVMKTWCAFPSIPKLSLRGKKDGVGNLYEQMAERGELKLLPGNVVNVHDFLSEVANDLQGHRVIVAGADRFRKAETLDALEKADLKWPIQFRGTGASATADGSYDVRAFQRLVQTKKLKVTKENLTMAHAIRNSAIRTDNAGNPALDKQKSRGRIDVLQAAVIACGFYQKNARPPALKFSVV